MTYGLRVINNDSELLIDSELVNPTFVQKLEFNTTPTFTEAGPSYAQAHPGYIRRDYSTANFSAASGGSYIVLWSLPDTIPVGQPFKDVWYHFPTSSITMSTSLRCSVYANSEGSPITYSLPTAYIFAVNAAAVNAMTSTGPALRMYNSEQVKTFDSNFVQLVPYSITEAFGIPGSGVDTSLFLPVPSNPIYLLPKSGVMFAGNNGYGFSNEKVFEATYRRKGQYLESRTLSLSYVDGKPELPTNFAAFFVGNIADLTVITADADFYQPSGSSTGGGTNPTYTLTSNYYSVNEGATFIVTLTTTLVNNGTAVPWTVTGINASDLSSGGLTGNFIIQNNTATATFTIRNDLALEGTEVFSLNLSGIAAQVNVSISDTSVPLSVFSFGAVTAVNEGTTTGYVNFEYNYAAGKVVQFAIVAPTSGTAATSADVTLNYLSSPGLVINQSNNGAGTFAVGYDVSADAKTEGTEYFRISATVDSTTYYSANIAINDTSLTPVSYSLTASNNWTESSTGNTATFNVTGKNGTTFYFTTDNTVVAPQTTSATANSDNYSINISYNVGLVTSTTSVTLQVRTGSASGTIVASKILSITNSAPSYSFGAVSAINEGSTGSVQFNYSNSAGVSFEFSATSPSSGEQNDGSGDVTVNVTNFTVGSTDAAGTVTITYSIGNDSTTEGPEYFRIQALVNGVYYTSDNILIYDTSTTPIPAYSIVAVSPPWNENTTQSTTVTLTNVNGYTYFPTSDNANVTCQTSTFTVNSNSYTTTLYWNVGSVTADTTVNLYLRRSRSTGVIDASTSVTVRNILPSGTYLSQYCSGVNLYYRYADGTYGGYYDQLYQSNSPTCGYIAPTYSLSASPNSVNEGGSFTITLTTNQSGSFAYTITGVSSADIGGGSLTGTLSNGGTRTITVTADSLTEGTEVFSIALDNGQASTNVSIADTSRNAISINQGGSTSGVQNSSFSTYFTTTVNGSQYPAIWSYSGAIPPGTSFTQSGGTYSNFYQIYYLSGTPTSSGTYPFTVYATASSGDSTSRSFSVTIDPPAYPARGTFIRSYCAGYSLYYTYHDGMGGEYDEFQGDNNASCGYVAPSYSLGNTWTSLANGSSGSFYVRSTNANGITLTPSISGAGAGRVSISPTSSTISSNGQTDTYFTITATVPTSTVSAQSVTVSVAGNSFSFTVQAYTVTTAPIITSISVDSVQYYPGEEVFLIINFSGPITADTYVNIRFSAGNYGQLYTPGYLVAVGPPGGSYTYGNIGLPIGATSAYYASVPNPGNGTQYNCRIYAMTMTAPNNGTARQAVVLSQGFVLEGGGGGVVEA